LKNAFYSSPQRPSNAIHGKASRAAARALGIEYTGGRPISRDCLSVGSWSTAPAAGEAVAQQLGTEREQHDDDDRSIDDQATKR
jgi:hypothetical protein